MKKKEEHVSRRYMKFITFYIIPITLYFFGLIEVFTASRYKAIELKNNEYYFAVIHLFWIILALGIAFLIKFVSPKIFKYLARFFYFVTLILLLAVFFTPAVNGSHRWFFLGPVLNFQPSELAKITLVLYAAFFTQSKLSKVSSFKNYSDHVQGFFLPFMLQIGIPIGLIALEPDLGTSLIILVATASIYLITPNKFLKYDILLLIIGASFLLIIAIFGVSYRSRRLNTYLTLITKGVIEDEYNSGYQLKNILIGVATGGLLGKGIGQSRQRHGYLVEVTAFTDSIVAVIFEELGFIASTIFILLYLWFYIYLIHTALSLDEWFTKAVLFGIANLFWFQSLMHFSANVGLIPVTGIPLPYITYGGSSIFTMGVITGMIWGFTSEKDFNKRVNFKSG